MRNYGKIIDHYKYDTLKRLIHKLNITKVDIFPFKSGAYRTAWIGRVVIHLIWSSISQKIGNSNSHLLIPRIRNGVEVVIPYPLKIQQKTESLQNLCLKRILNLRNLWHFQKKILKTDMFFSSSTESLRNLCLKRILNFRSLWHLKKNSENRHIFLLFYRIIAEFMFEKNTRFKKFVK